MGENKHTVTGIKADSVDGFLCTMNNCEDNCCRNTTWRISVDNATYEKYKTLGGELGEHILNCIEEKDGVYSFKEFDHGHCPLLAENGLCTIHRDLGADYLCKTCTNYPRVWNRFNGKPEFWLSLSCPDVIRWVLYRKKRINYMKAAATLTNDLPPPDYKENDKEKVRDMLIKIANHRRFTLKEKLIFMGLFMRSLSKTSIDSTIKAYCESMKTPKILAQIQADLAAVHETQRKEIFTLLAQAAATSSKPPKKIPEGIKNAKYYQDIGNFFMDVQINMTALYLTDSFDRLIVPYVNTNHYVFENYLVYSLVSTRFLNDTDDFAGAFAGFVGEFITMLTYTAGLFKNNETLSHDEMIIGMYLFHRVVSHNQSLRKHLASVFKNDILNMLLGALGDIH